LPNVTAERGEGLEVALVGGLHGASNPVLGRPELALGQAFPQRFKGDILESVPLKKLGCLCVYVS
jgi:hypothetical protein